MRVFFLLGSGGLGCLFAALPLTRLEQPCAGCQPPGPAVPGFFALAAPHPGWWSPRHAWMPPAPLPQSTRAEPGTRCSIQTGGQAHSNPCSAQASRKGCSTASAAAQECSVLVSGSGSGNCSTRLINGAECSTFKGGSGVRCSVLAGGGSGSGRCSVVAGNSQPPPTGEGNRCSANVDGSGSGQECSSFHPGTGGSGGQCSVLAGHTRPGHENRCSAQGSGNSCSVFANNAECSVEQRYADTEWCTTRAGSAWDGNCSVHGAEEGADCSVIGGPDDDADSCGNGAP